MANNNARSERGRVGSCRRANLELESSVSHSSFTFILPVQIKQRPLKSSEKDVKNCQKSLKKLCEVAPVQRSTVRLHGKGDNGNFFALCLLHEEKLLRSCSIEIKVFGRLVWL